jgi:hypothetical protein
MKRWSIEETIRFIKQTYDLENIRVLRYARLQNMMALLLALVFPENCKQTEIHQSQLSFGFG